MIESDISPLWNSKNKFLLNKKNYTFKDAYQKVIESVLPKVKFIDNCGYEQREITYKNNYGILKTKVIVFNKNTSTNIFEWSWMNSINTNWSCTYFLINEINKIITENSLNFNLLLFNDLSSFSDHFETFYKVLFEYKDQIFNPTEIGNNSVFSLMKYKTQETWYDGKIAEIFVAQNINRYIEDITKFDFDFCRGNDEDMNKGIDLRFYKNDNSFTIQNKKGKPPIDDGENFIFLIYYKKQYAPIDYFIVANYKDNILYIINNKGHYENGIHCDPFNYSKIKVRKDLVIPKLLNMNELENELSMTLYKLLLYCCENKIDFNMGVPDDKTNKITFNEDNKSIYVEYIDFDDNMFLEKVVDVFEKVKIKTT